MSIAFKSKATKPLSVFTLVMINVIAVDSLRNLTVGAEFGFSLIFFYVIAALFFFIPSVLITAELATGWPITGGAYVWIREAFGPRCGFLAIWLQWIYNVVWFPTIFAFIAGVIAYLINPALVENRCYMLSVILSFYWLMTIINCLGIKTSNVISVIGAIMGTIFPMTLIGLLGVLWWFVGNKSQIEFSLSNLFPRHADFQNLAFLTNILFGLMGMEMSAVHAGDVQNPSKDYPLALFYSAILILVTLILASLAITIVIPITQLNLVSGLIDAFQIFFNAYGLSYFVPLMAILIVVGCLSGAGAWIVGPARGLLVACEDSNLPIFFRKLNVNQMPVGILLVQGIIVTFLCLLFFIMPTVKSSYWLLSNLTAQLALIFYILLFAAAIRLHYKYFEVKRAFKIPGGKVGVWLVSGIGILFCLGAILLGFWPPSQLAISNTRQYECILAIGIMTCCLPPFLLHSFYRNRVTSMQID